MKLTLPDFVGDEENFPFRKAFLVSTNGDSPKYSYLLVQKPHLGKLILIIL